MSFHLYSNNLFLMKAMHTIFAVLIVSWATVTAAAADKHEHAVIGKWRVTAALDGAQITSLDEREAQQLVGRVFTISKAKVNFGKRDCGPSTFEVHSVDPQIFLNDQFRASADRLRLPNPVTVVDLSCTSVFIKNTNTLVIAWDGWFFNAVRIKR
jgi:hypothetical protein